MRHGLTVDTGEWMAPIKSRRLIGHLEGDLGLEVEVFCECRRQKLVTAADRSWWQQPASHTQHLLLPIQDSQSFGNHRCPDSGPFDLMTWDPWPTKTRSLTTSTPVDKQGRDEEMVFRKPVSPDWAQLIIWERYFACSKMHFHTLNSSRCLKFEYC